ncbi:FAD-dependent monooxygenase [Microbacterium sp. MPKO10]|uniref:FAD-dependent monooxygenase n=1 Tax=Microbacterium sp. MPKO10 TaxID=2989818 RepID=UPI00223631FB|nr:FAD-dependent monooxygenase [Microbacterium sp. MPKO10]MCW4459942.1 FAD-dependent monooxygenase [Microbacterium sp. MPKO10]
MTQVLVVGAGPTGLALACGLRMADVDVRVVDRAPRASTASRANFLHARGSEVLSRLGALGALPDESKRAMSVTSYLGERPLARLQFGNPAMHTAAPPMVISQARVEGELRRRLAELGVEPEWESHVTTVTQSRDDVVAELSSGEQLHASWLVGCDGTSSTVRKSAGIGAPGVRLSERFLLADVHLDWDLDRSGTTGWIHPSGLLGVMPMPDPSGDLWRVLAYDPDGSAGSSAPISEAEVLQRISEILPERSYRPDVRIGDAEWLSQFTVHRKLADTYRAGRLFLAGDAAHAHAPFGGQGMLTGLGDAENLAWKLAAVVRSRASADFLDTYEAERRPLAKDVLRGTSAVTAIDVTRSVVGRFVRDRVMAPLLGLPVVQRKATWAASQMWVSYHRGPLGRRFGPRPRPGARVDDVQSRDADGATTSLHACLGGTWAILRPPGGRDDAVPPLLNELAVVLERTDAVAETWLVRPDAHLAWRGVDERQMCDMLDSWFGIGK